MELSDCQDLLEANAVLDLEAKKVKRVLLDYQDPREVKVVSDLQAEKVTKEPQGLSVVYKG